MKIPKLFALKPKRKLHATARRAAPQAMDDYDDEPQTKLSSAFIVVLILHVVAVGGIYAFNGIKAHRLAKQAAFATPAELSKPIAPIATQTPEAQAPAAQRQATLAASAPAPRPPAAGKVHRVKAGENLTRIAAQHDVSIADLAAANGLKTTAILRTGQALNIPPAAGKTELARKTETAAPKAAAAPARTPATPGKTVQKTYTVVSGDNPVTIARKLNVSQAELVKLNNITDPKRLQIGQTLKIPPKKTD